MMMTSQIRDAVVRFDAARAALDALEAGPPAGDRATDVAVDEWAASSEGLAGLLSAAGFDSVRSGGRTYTPHRPGAVDAPASVQDGIIAVGGKMIDLDGPAAGVLN